MNVDLCAMKALKWAILWARPCSLWLIGQFSTSKVLTSIYLYSKRGLVFYTAQRYSLDEYCNSRRNAVVKLFIDALTKGSPSSKPIELNSHDPIRYMGDMLAWIHQATASEHEFLRSLFRKFPENDELNNTVRTSLGSVIDGVCRTLKIRIEQILVSRQDTILYKISNLIKFYEYTIK